MRGRKPKPNSLRIAQDQHLLSDHPQDLVVPDKPDWLTGHASEEWDRIVPLIASRGYVIELDSMMLASYCESYALWRLAKKDVEDRGLTFEDSHGNLKHNPAIKTMHEAMAEMRRIAGEFGFTPAARSRVRVSPTGGNEGDELKEFLDGP